MISVKVTPVLWSGGMPQSGTRQEKGAKSEKTVFGVTPSPEPDVVLALLFYPLQRKHTLIQTI